MVSQRVGQHLANEQTGTSICWNQSFGFPERAKRRLPSNPTIYTTSPSLDEDRPLVWLMVHFPHPIPFHIILVYPFLIAHNKLF